MWATAFAVLAAIALASSACSSRDSTGGADAGDEPWLRAQATWTSLFDVYFGPSGVAACSGGSTCHNSMDQTGAVASNFICPDKESCFQSLTGTSSLVRSQDGANPSATPLLHKLRTPGGSGSMPSNSTFTFQPQDFDVIESWIAKGAPDD